MLSFINMECPECGAEYTLSIEELNIIVLFKCFECEQHNMYVAGHLLKLDPEIMQIGTEKEKKRHIVETAQLFALEFAGNVIENVDRIINVNMETEIPETSRPKKKKRKKKAAREKEIQGARLSPSIKLENTREITSKEVKDFKRIDLELIDRKEYFDHFFGSEEE